jgi:hypothetical protein
LEFGFRMMTARMPVRGSEDENLLPAMCKAAADMGDEMPVLPSIYDELAAHYHHRRLRRDDHLLPVQVLVATS